MATEKIVLIFALLGSALYVFEKAVAIIAAAIRNVKATPVAAPNSVLKQEPKMDQQQQLIPAQSRDQIARMLGLLESLAVANEEMKDTQAELLQRIAALEAAPATPKVQAQKRSRAKKMAPTTAVQENGEAVGVGYTLRSEDRSDFEVIS